MQQVTETLRAERDEAQKRLYEAAERRPDARGRRKQECREWRQRLLAKKELTEREDAIRKDVEVAAAAVGESEHITMIFGKYRTNLTARDVTARRLRQTARNKGRKAKWDISGGAGRSS